MTDTLLINSILNTAFERRATDVHLVAGNNPVIRVDGRLSTVTEEKILTPDIILGMAESFLSKEELDKLNHQRELVTIYSWSNRARFRAKLFYQKGYLAMSLRLIQPIIRSPRELGIPPAIVQLLNKDKGLIIITGPFGSGRTTSAVSLIETLNQNKGLHIQTLERPIEYLFSNNQSVIEQREVGKDVDTFVSGLKNMVDEDIDVVFIDSLHEDGMEENILELAESGKLVLVTMDADSVISAIERFISNLPSERRQWGQDLLAELLIGVLNQRLLTRLGGGQALAAGVLTSTSAVRSSIKDSAFYQLNSIMQTSKDEGMMILDKSLLSLVRAGQVAMDEARAQALDPQAFK